MDREQLQNIFRQKINNELKIFKCQLFQKNKEEIWDNAYKIICMTSIYEKLLELSQKMSTDELQAYIQLWGILEFVYSEWLKNPETEEHSLWSYTEEILKSVA